MIPSNTFKAIMAVLASSYPKYELQPETLTAYHAVLADLDVALLKAATLHIAATSKWFPAASEIRAAAFELVEQAEGVPDAYQAWTQVLSEIGRVGRSGRPGWTHEAVGATVKAIGGWGYLCMSENMVADRARFVEAYGMTVKRERETMRMLPAVRAEIEKVAGLLTGGLKQLSRGSE